MTTWATVEHAKRAFALKKYEQAVEHYASALELVTKKHGEDALETADLYFAYGKALLEHAISQAGVLGKQDPDEPVEDDKDASNSGAFLSFSGDAEDEAVDLFGAAQKAVEEADAAAEEDEEDDDDDDDAEPEDDFNAAWEVLDLARAIFEKQPDPSDELKLKLAEVFITLGDVSLETEKFEQAISDYEAGLALKDPLLPLSSRQIAEAHYKLSIVLDLTAGRLGDSIVHAERALDSVEARLAELRVALSGQGLVKSEGAAGASGGKGKGKATGAPLEGDDAVSRMSKSQMEAEEKELNGLREDLALKVEELKTSPNESAASAPELAAQALDKELNARSSAAAPSAVKTEVNDLTGLVKKKKKNTDANGAAPPPVASASLSSGKRKAEDGAESDAHSEKKAKVEEGSVS
ncbi:uncharacterized protein BXZ73DRAFT_91713 [Epithele typhae]|uniref:uncharacterized protein n=1 Tax=Epithele typhae TaxID=378194 RepID=UPI002007ADA5|nr:uncharacterized protein BXZ73DRAFT_91713 [Epithele typhae]KAH9921679.1 hypothetical protein BXZ73DRAFT_91713 [Epithele typhae]